MSFQSAALTVFAMALEAGILVRAIRGRFLSRYLLFYSYVGYILVSSMVTLLIYLYGKSSYADAYWFNYMITLLVEFAVLVEISDHIFSPYPAVRHLGRLLIVCICAPFFVWYLIPPLFGTEPTTLLILEFVKRASLTKAVVIVALLAMARYLRLPLGKNVTGLVIGFSIYLGTGIANFTLAAKYGKEFYAPTFSTILRLSYALSLLVWMTTLWNYQPALSAERRSHPAEASASGLLSHHLGRFNAELLRLLRK